MSRGVRAAICLTLAAITLLLGSIAVVVGAVPLQLAWTAGGFIPAGIYASLVVAVAIGAPIVFLVAAFVALLFGDDQPR